MSFVSIPRHIAVIMDGNRRWARNHGTSLLSGYEAGLKSALRMVKMCITYGISYLTLYALSTENVAERDGEELNTIFELVESGKYMKQLLEVPVCVTFMGEDDCLPLAARKVAKYIVGQTAHGDKIRLKIALNYGSKQEITSAARRIAEDVLSGALDTGNISPETITERLYDGALPDPDLLIRTGCDNRVRLSNFMLWQLAYTELLFSNTLWPDYADSDFQSAISEFSNRKRMFGK